MLVVLGRIGLAARGVVYILVGSLAAFAGVGVGGGKVVDQRGAMRVLDESPLGHTALYAVAIGLGAYVLWRFGQVILGPSADVHGRKDLFKRIVALMSGCAYAGLSATAFAQAIGRSSGDGGSAQRKGATWLMSQPFGQWLAVIVALIIIGVAVAQFYRAVTASFAKHLQGERLTATQELWTRRAGRAGFAARGVAFGIMGWLFLQAGLQHNARQAGGLADALQMLAAQPEGPTLLMIIGAGLAMFGVYSLIESRYRQID